MYGSLDISTSGMIAQRTRLEVIASNLANQHTLRDASGRLNPYQRHAVMFAPGDPSASTPEGRAMGVHVSDIAVDGQRYVPKQYDPTSPDAFKSGPLKGYVADTNVNPVIENVSAMEALRAYQANVQAAEATKQMEQLALRLVA